MSAKRLAFGAVSSEGGRPATMRIIATGPPERDLA